MLKSTSCAHWALELRSESDMAPSSEGSSLCLDESINESASQCDSREVTGRPGMGGGVAGKCLF